MSLLDYTEESCKAETRRHIGEVERRMMAIATELMRRALVHDKSKLESPELECFTEFTPKLRTTEYMSEEYLANLKAMEPALKHHYAKNDHHPEHHAQGVNDMNLINLIEMFCDWDAATSRHATGDIYQSIIANSERFQIDPQMTKVLLNTVVPLRELQKK